MIFFNYMLGGNRLSREGIRKNRAGNTGIFGQIGIGKRRKAGKDKHNWWQNYDPGSDC